MNSPDRLIQSIRRWVKRLLPALLLLFTCLFKLFGQDGYPTREDDFKVILDSCGTHCLCIREGNAYEGVLTCQERRGALAGESVVYRTRESYRPWCAGCINREVEHAVDLQSIRMGEGIPETTTTPLLTWTYREDGQGGDFDRAEITASETGLKLFYNGERRGGEGLLALFQYKQGRLILAPEFRKRILEGFDRKDSTLTWFGLRWILSESGWPDAHLMQVLQLYDIRDYIRSGAIDTAIDTLDALVKEAADGKIRRYCRHWLDSLQAWKKEIQPATLAEARRIGSILAAPIYPPLDSPTVFWRDSLLCVIQEGGRPEVRMRIYDTRTMKWGEPVPAKYPETGMSRLFEKPKVYSIACRQEVFCWHEKLGPPSEDPCDGLECGRLLILDDPTRDSVENLPDRIRAGGSCAAANGELEFRDAGVLYYRGKSDYGWRLFPRKLAYGTREYPFPVERKYPVVVSPDQRWVAYAMEGKDGSALGLWVARLKYNLYTP